MSYVNDANTPNEQVQCPNCGAMHSADDEACPYCGTLNPAGAEKAYMEDLADLKEDTGELAEEAQDDFEEAVQGNVKRIITVIAIVVAAIALLLFAVNSCEKSAEQREIQSYQERESFREQYFTELDRLYEEGDDAALSEYAWSLMDQPGYDALYSWKHINYLWTYNDWEIVKLFSEMIQEEPGSLDDYVWTVKTAIELARLDGSGELSSPQFTQEEEARLADYRAFGLSFLEDTLQMSESEVTAFAASALDDDGFVDEAKLKSVLEPRLHQLGTIR